MLKWASRNNQRWLRVVEGCEICCWYYQIDFVYPLNIGWVKKRFCSEYSFIGHFSGLIASIPSIQPVNYKKQKTNIEKRETKDIAQNVIGSWGKGAKGEIKKWCDGVRIGRNDKNDRNSLKMS